MANIELKQSPVIAIDDNCEVAELRHTYWMNATKEDLVAGKADDAKQLYGITSTILNFALGDDYKGWTGSAEANKNAAAERGHNVHTDIENMCVIGAEPSTLEGWNFRHVADEHGWNIIANEHIVSDENKLASAIDLVFINRNGELCIGDIKTYSATTARQKKARTSLQTSIYKYFLENSNEGLEVKHLYEIRLRDKDVEVTELPQVATTTIKELLEAYYKSDLDYKYTSAPEWFEDIEITYLKLLAEKESIDKQIDELKQKIQAKMAEDNQTTIKGYQTTISLTKGRTTTTFDYKGYSADHAEQVSAYCNMFDEKKFLKDHGKDEEVASFITTKTGASTLRVVVNK